MQALKNYSCQGRIKGYALSGSLDKERAFSTARFVLHDNRLRKISCIFENNPFFELRHTYLLTIATLIYAYILHTVTTLTKSFIVLLYIFQWREPFIITNFSVIYSPIINHKCMKLYASISDASLCTLYLHANVMIGSTQRFKQ